MLAKLRPFFLLYRDLYRGHKGRVATLLILGVLNGFLGSIGVVALVPLFGIVMQAQGADDNAVSKAIFSIFSYFGFQPTVFTLVSLIISIFILKAIVLYIFHYVGGVISADISNSVRKEFFMRTIYSKWSYLVGQKVGYLENTLLNDLAVVVSMVTRMFAALNEAVSFIAYAATVFYISFFVSLLALASGAAILVLSKLFIRNIRAQATIATTLRRSMFHFVSESVLGLKTIKALNAEAANFGKLSGILDESKKISLKLIKVRGLMSNPVEPLSVIFISLLFAFSYKLPSFNFATFLVTVYMIRQIFTYTEKFQVIMRDANEAVPSIKRVYILRDTLLDNQEEKDGAGRSHRDFIFTNALTFENLSFSYAAGREVLKELNFQIPKGTTAALVGVSGAGKTTIADLIMRFLEPSAGRLLMDGIDAREYKLSGWRRSVGYVSQDIFIMDATIEDNIKFYDKSITDAEVIEAAKMANIYNFIEQCPKKMKTQVGDRGLFLSGGQRQRLALARVLARHPKILLLDEATSSLDGESETLIKKTLEELKGKITIIIIAHRFSTISGVDKIFVLEQGCIVEDGSPRELLKSQRSYFYKMYHHQTNV